jgi:hypothetical protein
MKHQVLFSGSFRFVAKRLDEMSDIGYSIVGYTRLPNGHWTYIMEKEIR